MEAHNDLNKAIHSYLKKCWHDWPLDEYDMPTLACSNCEAISEKWPTANPDYLNSIEHAREFAAKVCEEVGVKPFGMHLVYEDETADDLYDHENAYAVIGYVAALATASVIAKAAAKAAGIEVK